MMTEEERRLLISLREMVSLYGGWVAPGTKINVEFSKQADKMIVRLGHEHREIPVGLMSPRVAGLVGDLHGKTASQAMKVLVDATSQRTKRGQEG